MSKETKINMELINETTQREKNIRQYSDDIQRKLQKAGHSQKYVKDKCLLQKMGKESIM